MKGILKFLKWIGLFIGALIVLMILVVLYFQIFGPKPKPSAKMVEVNGLQLHYNASGVQNELPTVVIESGAGTPCESYHWFSENLKDKLRVVRYDREGLGYSDLSSGPRTPQNSVKELHDLLMKNGEKPPYILVGHSLGGLYIRAFAKAYPEEIAAMIFVDASHPEQVQRFEALGFPNPLNMDQMKLYARLGDWGILAPLDRIIGPVYGGEGLPDSINHKAHEFFANGKCVRGFAQEMERSEKLFDLAGQLATVDSLPVRVFTANKEMTKEEKASLENIGIDPVIYRAEWLKMQKEIANLSSNTGHVLLDGSHMGVVTEKKNVDRITNEIIQLLEVKD